MNNLINSEIDNLTNSEIDNLTNSKIDNLKDFNDWKQLTSRKPEHKPDKSFNLLSQMLHALELFGLPKNSDYDSKRGFFENPNSTEQDFIKKGTEFVMTIFLMYSFNCNTIEEIKHLTIDKKDGSDFFNKYKQFFDVFTFALLFVFQTARKYPDHKTFYIDFEHQLECFDIQYHKKSSQNGVIFKINKNNPLSLNNKEEPISEDKTDCFFDEEKDDTSENTSKHYLAMKNKYDLPVSLRFSNNFVKSSLLSTKQQAGNFGMKFGL